MCPSTNTLVKVVTVVSGIFMRRRRNFLGLIAMLKGIFARRRRKITLFAT